MSSQKQEEQITSNEEKIHRLQKELDAVREQLEQLQRFRFEVEYDELVRDQPRRIKRAGSDPCDGH
ncbi:hypothetical protein CL632_03310 [bacterium]|jgi:transposase-like protein|nr:hypothetical protein [bacterium]|tara:strand:- start:13411 stop:13608 length:198 start_codon:yes stop_codon:yes gene_type:complete